MVISESNDLKLLVKMHDACNKHINRSLDKESEDYSPKKAKELKPELEKVKNRISELVDNGALDA